jgi:hypothetical protein
MWDGVSQGCLFDLGMAFAMNKHITIISIPELSNGKSFQNMVKAYTNNNKEQQKDQNEIIYNVHEYDRLHSDELDALASLENKEDYN